MIIVRIFGGLGNQMFQYAAGRAVAHQAGLPLKLDIQELRNNPARQYRLDIFNIAAEIATEAEIQRFLPSKSAVLPWTFRQAQRRLLPFHLRPVIIERQARFDPALSRVKHRAYLLGYWQSEAYFRAISDTIRQEFTFRPKPDAQNQAILAQMDATQSVSLHVRRGDYVQDPTTNKTHGVLAQEYYQKAVQFITERVAQPHFFVFSDEIEWVKAHLPLPATTTYVDHNGAERDYEDLRLMSHCRHHIIANSSFSWWGAWLAHAPEKIVPEKIVIAPQQWYTDLSRVPPSLYPPGWIRL